ncbi:MAG TPA: endonuclease/exonuclease/phosphatase family protein [Burkholderiales bacterium]|nr:endonuclease/exonuclease/phosphatase family protein [Burkholderiales bacterium]
MALIGVALVSSCSSIHLGKTLPCDARNAVDPWPDSPGLRLHLLVWNLHGPPSVGSMDARLSRIARAILETRPDVVLLQEIWFRGDADRLSVELGQAYRRIEEPAAVTQHLGWVIGFRKSGLLALSRRDSSWTVRQPSTVQWFAASASKWLIWQGDGLAYKGIQRVELMQNGHHVILLNTHLQSSYLAHEDLFGHSYPHIEVRRRQIQELKVIASLEKEGTVLVAGDLNTVPEEADWYAELNPQLHDLTAAFRNDCHCGTIVDETGVRRDWIDYLLSWTRDSSGLVVEKMRLVSSEKVDCPFSDHHGLEALIRLDQPDHSN